MLVLALLPFVVFWAETLGLRVFYYHDVQYYFFPYHKLVVDITKQGALPLWNPHSFSGIPLLADGQTAIFYPPNLIFWLLPPAQALTLVILLQFSIAGVGMFAYARRLRLGLLAATVAALTFMWSGFLVARVVHLSILAGAACIPLVFWSFERLIQQRSYGAWAVATGCVALQTVTGHPQVPIYTAVALGVYVLSVSVHALWHTHSARALLPLVYLASIYVTGYLLAAIQLVPWVEFASFSPRAAGATYKFVTGESLRSWDWVLFLFPYAFGGLRTTLWQSMPALELPALVYVWERLGYVGLLPLMLAGVGLIYGWSLQRVSLKRLQPVAGRRAAVQIQASRWWALLAAGIISALIAAGAYTPFGHVVYALPVIGRLRGYARAVVLVSFALAVLAAYGVERLCAWRRPVRSVWWSGAAVVLLVGGVLVFAPMFGNNLAADPNNATTTQHNTMLHDVLRINHANAYVPFVLCVVSAGVLWWLHASVTRTKAAILIGVLLADLLGVATSFYPTTDPAVFSRVPPSVQFLQRDHDLFRVASFVIDDRLPPATAQSQLAISWALPYGIDEINGFNSLQPRRYTDVLWGPDVDDVSYGFLGDAALLQPPHHLLTMLNVKYVLVQPQAHITPPAPWQQVFADDTVTIYRNGEWHGRATFADQVSVFPTAASVLDSVRQPQFDGSRTALLENTKDLPAMQRLNQTGPAEVRVERSSPNALRIHTHTDTARYLILSEMWFPGWQATLENGTPLPIYRTNYLLRGLLVPPGEHTIRMEYRPTSVFTGALVTAGTAGMMVGGALVRWRRHPKPT